MAVMMAHEGCICQLQ